MGLKKGRVKKEVRTTYTPENSHVFLKKRAQFQKETSLPTINFHGGYVRFPGEYPYPRISAIGDATLAPGNWEIHHPPAAWSMGMSLAPSPTAMVC